MKTPSLLAILLSLTLLGYNSFAQNIQNPDDKKAISFDPKVTARAWQEGILELRESAEALLKENQKLSSENSLLFKTLSNLKKSIEAAKEENAKLTGEPARLSGLIKEEDEQNKLLTKEIKEIENKISLLTKENSSFKQKLSRLEEKQKPWETEIANLNAKKVELTLELNSKQLSPQKEAERLKVEIQTLKDLVIENEKKENDIKSTTAEISKQYSSSASDTGKLKKENEALSNELSKLKNAQKLSTQEMEALKKKNSAIGQSNRDTTTKMVKEKKELEDKTKQLEDKIAEMNRLIESQAVSHFDQKKENLHNTTVSDLIKENKDLKDRISNLKEAILVVKRENSMIEALLQTQKKAQEESRRIQAESSLREGMVESQNISEAMGYAFASQGKYEEAIQKYEEALKQSKNKRNIYFNLGYIYFRMGNIKEAIKNYEIVLKMDPEDHEAKRNLINLHEKISHLSP